MALITAADVAFALQDFSGASSPNVTYGAQTCYGNLNRAAVHEVMNDELERLGTHITLLIADGSLTGLTNDTPITVDGGNFVIRDVGPLLQDNSRLLTLVDA